MPDLFVAKKAKGETKSSSSLPLNLSKDRAGNHPHMFTSLAINPDGIFFEDKEEDEKILLFIRRHFITNLRWILLAIALALIPIPLIYFRDTFSFLPFVNLPLRFITFFLIFYYLVIFTYMFVNFITWYFNIGLITNKRVIDIDFSGLIYTNVAATKISLVQDASYTQIGAIRSFFNYADVLVQTAGTLDNFIFEAVPQPEKIVKIVESLIGKRADK